MSDDADRPGAGADAGAVAPASRAVGATPVALDLPETVEAPADRYQNVGPSDPGALKSLADMVPGPA
ncbi:hypothetical protein ACFVYE_30970 [Streptomyces sp. NPDC058239]|uniref:hypothetical protein n=1 Tax=Streptomyces sp. NPDC058239 TaxID=3346395 RepID=UPI0036E35C7F